MPRPPANSKQQGIVGSALYSGSKFQGCLRYTVEKYDVEVLLKNVDEENGYMCGYFTVKIANEDTPDMTTYFDAEIINKKYPFLTKKKWRSNAEVDEEYWSRFPAFSQFAEDFNSDAFDYGKLKNSDHVFMRLKEHFVVPDHALPDPTGASFNGFYYMCFQKSTSSIEGNYFHPDSNAWYSKIYLTHVPERIIQIYEFR